MTIQSSDFSPLSNVPHANTVIAATDNDAARFQIKRSMNARANKLEKSLPAGSVEHANPAVVRRCKRKSTVSAEYDCPRVSVALKFSHARTI
jgi:hypothetical protein